MQRMGTQVKEDFLLNHLNWVSRESVTQFGNQSQQSTTVQTLTWDVDAAVDESSDTYMSCILVQHRRDKKSKWHFPRNILFHETNF